MECKYIMAQERLRIGIELIDTLWNVNQHTHANYAKRTNRINRYIMECK